MTSTITNGLVASGQHHGGGPHTLRLLLLLVIVAANQVVRVGPVCRQYTKRLRDAPQTIAHQQQAEDRVKGADRRVQMTREEGLKRNR